VKDIDDAVALPDAPPFAGTLIERCADETTEMRNVAWIFAPVTIQKNKVVAAL